MLRGIPVLEMLLILVYLVFMFGIPVTTEKVWIDSVCTVRRERKIFLAQRMNTISAGVYSY
jgi:hypothetical protein